MFAVKQAIQGRDSRLGDVLVGFGVVMPFTTFTTESPEIIQGVLLDKRRFGHPLKQYISSLAAYWEVELARKHGQSYQAADTRRSELPGRFCWPDLETALSLGGYLTGLMPSCCSSRTNRSARPVGRRLILEQ